MDSAHFVSAAIGIATALHPDRRATLRDQARDVLSEFEKVVPYASAELALWDRDSSEHRAVLQVGYEDDVLDLLNGEMLVNDLCWPVMWRRKTPTRWRDCGFDPNRSMFFREVLRPNGYHEGMYVPLFSGENYIGMFTLNTDDASIPTDDSMTFASQVSSLIASSMERALLSTTSVGPHYRYATIDVETGATSQELDTGYPVPTVVRASFAAALAAPVPITRFTCWPEYEKDPFMIRFIAPGDRIVKPIIRWHSSKPPFGLTRRQLEILTLVADGLSNSDIATKLFLSVRTVTTHVERILVRLGVPGRVAATRLALTSGLILV